MSTQYKFREQQPLYTLRVWQTSILIFVLGHVILTIPNQHEPYTPLELAEYMVLIWLLISILLLPSMTILYFLTGLTGPRQPLSKLILSTVSIATILFNVWCVTSFFNRATTFYWKGELSLCCLIVICIWFFKIETYGLIESVNWDVSKGAKANVSLG